MLVEKIHDHHLGCRIMKLSYRVSHGSSYQFQTRYLKDGDLDGLIKFINVKDKDRPLIKGYSHLSLVKLPSSKPFMDLSTINLDEATKWVRDHSLQMSYDYYGDKLRPEWAEIHKALYALNRLGVEPKDLIGKFR